MTNSTDEYITNADRAERAHRTIEAYSDGCDADASVIDLLADIQHWCDKYTQCYGDLDRIVHQHYLAELGEERGLV